MECLINEVAEADSIQRMHEPFRVTIVKQLEMSSLLAEG